MICKLSDAYFARTLSLADLDGPWPGWFEDQDVCKYNSHGKLTKTSAYFRAYFDDLNHHSRIVWAICHINDGHIGNISLQQISPINRSAEFAIILGDKGHWGKGVGLLAGKALVEHGFYKVNLDRIYCGTAVTNQGMIKLARCLQMVQEGIRREHLFLEGNKVDVVEFGVLRSEYQVPV